MGGAKAESEDGFWDLCSVKRCPSTSEDLVFALRKYESPGWKGFGRKRYRDFMTYSRQPSPQWGYLYQTIKKEAVCLGESEVEKARKIEELKTLKQEQCLAIHLLSQAGRDHSMEPDFDVCEPILRAFPSPEVLTPMEWSSIITKSINAMDEQSLATAATRRRNYWLQVYNNMMAKYNLLVLECDRYVCMTAANLQKLLGQRNCLSQYLANSSTSDRHIGDALQMETNHLLQRQWELDQVEEVLKTLAYSVPRSRFREDKIVDALTKAKEVLADVGPPSKAIAIRRNMITEFQESLGQLDGTLRYCIVPSMRRWYASRSQVKLCFVIFMALVHDGLQTGVVDKVVHRAIVDSNFEYADDPDWLEQLAIDRGIFTALFDIDQAISFLDNLPDQIGKYSAAYAEHMQLEELTRPWSLMAADMLSSLSDAALRNLRLIDC